MPEVLLLKDFLTEPKKASNSVVLTLTRGSPALLLPNEESMKGKEGLIRSECGTLVPVHIGPIFAHTHTV